MARNGSGVYALPSGSTFVPNTTIQSAKVNEILTDLAADNNLARPITAGGTGATSASGARDNFGVDAAHAFATKSANYTALETDNNATHRFSAAATLSLTAAATLGSGWHYTVIADGGAVTIDPNGAELVNGAATQVLPQGFTTTIVCDGSAFRTTSINSVLTDLASIGFGAIANYLTGYTLSNNATDSVNDIDVAPGVCVNSLNTAMIVLAASITKRIDSNWSVGTNQGGLDTGSVTNATYHVFAIKRPDTGVVDALFSLSATAPTLPTNYTLFRRIGSILNDGVGNKQFIQNGDDFLFNTPSLDVDVSNQGTSEVLRVLRVPTGIKVDAKIRVRASNASGWVVIISSPDAANLEPSATVTPLSDLGAAGGTADRATLVVRTDTSGQIRTRSSASNTDLKIATYGWIDTRGK